MVPNNYVHQGVNQSIKSNIWLLVGSAKQQCRDLFQTKDFVQWLIHLHMSPKKTHSVLPVHCAARKGALPVLRLLAQRGVDLKGRDNGQWTILHHAAAGGHTSVLKTMLLGGLMLPPPPPSAGPEEAGSAGRSSSPSAVLDVNVRAADGTTPLLVAVMEGHPAAVRCV